MLTPKKLRFSGIGPFVEEQVVDFTNLANLVQIVGESGSGKSTMFNAMDFLFGISDLPNTVLETYVQKMPLSVSCDFDFDGQPLTITRAKNKLTIDLNGEVTSGSNKLAEEKLDEIIGMPRALFKPMLHKIQKSGGFFLDFTPKEKYEFMTSALGLGEYQKKLEKIEIAASTAEKDKDRAESDLRAAQTGLLATQEAIASLGETPAQEVTQQTVLALKQVADLSSEQLKALQLGHNSQLSILEQERPALQRPEMMVEAYDGRNLTVLLSSLRGFEVSVVNLRKQETERVATVNQKIAKLTDDSFANSTKMSLGATAKNEAIKVAAEIKKIRAGICATCEQSWVHDSAKAHEVELMGKISFLKNQIEAAGPAQVRLDEIKAELAALSIEKTPTQDPAIFELELQIASAKKATEDENLKMRAHQATQAEANKTVMTAYDQELAQVNALFRTKQETLSNTQRWEVNAIRDSVESDRKAFELAVSGLQSYNEAKKRFDSSDAKLKVQEAEYLKKASALENTTLSLAQRSNTLDEVRRAVKSYVSSKFDDALASVAEAATTMIRLIPNMANATIQLDGTKETKDGKIKEEVNAVIHKDGFENVHIKSLSGGQRSSVDIAIDLAVIDFLEERTNKGISLFVMDEPFVGIPTAGIEQILEMLQNYKSDKQIIISDHNPIIEEFIQSKIYVSKNGPTSTISLISL